MSFLRTEFSARSFSHLETSTSVLTVVNSEPKVGQRRIMGKKHSTEQLFGVCCEVLWGWWWKFKKVFQFFINFTLQIFSLLILTRKNIEEVYGAVVVLPFPALVRILLTSEHPRRPSEQLSTPKSHEIRPWVYSGILRIISLTCLACSERGWNIE